MGKINKTVVCDSNKDFEQELVVGQEYSTSAEDANFYKIVGLWFPKGLFHDYLEEEEEEIQKPIGTVLCTSVGEWTTLTAQKEYPYYGVVGTQYYELDDDKGDRVWADQFLFHRKEVVTVDDGEEHYKKDKPYCDGRCLTDNCRACKDAYEMGDAPEPDTEEEEDFSLKSFVHGVEHGTIVDYIIVGTRVNGEGLLLSTLSEEPAKDLLTSALNCLLEADGVQIKRTTDEPEKLNSEDLRDIKTGNEEVSTHIEQFGSTRVRVDDEQEGESHE